VGWKRPSALSVGVDGSINLGRGATCPLLMTCRVESVKYESTPVESYVRVSGRCWGERLLRREVTKTYEDKKGEEIVKDLLDYYVGLSHIRDSTELVEDTDTTYTRLEYQDTPVIGILRYVADKSVPLTRMRGLKACRLACSCFPGELRIRRFGILLFQFQPFFLHHLPLLHLPRVLSLKSVFQNVQGGGATAVNLE
jgi:hypothetical protein